MRREDRHDARVVEPFLDALRGHARRGQTFDGGLDRFRPGPALGFHRALAQHMTELLHGADGLAQAQKTTEALFSGNVAELSQAAIAELFGSAPSASLPKDRLAGDGYLAVDLLVDGQVVKSKREAREFLGNGAILINGRTPGADARVQADWLLHGEVLLIRRGRKNWHVARFA